MLLPDRLNIYRQRKVAESISADGPTVATRRAGCYHELVNVDYRQALVAISARLDQMLAGADGILAGPGDEELVCSGEDLRDWIVRMQAKVEEKLERGGP